MSRNAEIRGAGGFWSRRRAAVEAEERAETEAEARARAEQERKALEEKSDAEILEDLKLPDPDTLQKGDDFSGFLRSEVPERLRRRALRRLWRSNPVLACLDRLVDYDDDFTDAATVVPDLKTTYQVGKGLLAHIEAQNTKNNPTEAGAPRPPEDNAPATPDPTEAARAEQPGSPGEPARHEAPDTRSAEAGDERQDALPQGPASVSPRRLRFVYGGTQEETS